MEEGSLLIGGRVAENEPLATRKRVRSGHPEDENSPSLPDAEPVAKKMSVSDVDVKSMMDRVALLDAGAQYGKVREEEAILVPYLPSCR